MLLPAAIAISLGVGALLFWRSCTDRTRILARMALGMGATSLPAGLVFALLAAFGPSRQLPQTDVPPAVPTGTVALVQADYPERPLGAGDVAPPFDAPGWFNGAAPAPAGAGARVTVVDLWTLWSPGCAATAPDLVQLYHKYKDRGVAFVSVTNMPREGVQQFVDTFEIPWPCAYEATSETFAKYGAFNWKNKLKGYEVNPTFYLVGPDSRVLWNDGQERLKHLQRFEFMMPRIEEQLERALANSAPAGAKESLP